MRRTPLRPGKSLSRSSGLTRSTGVRPANRKRKAANHERAYGTKRDWIVDQDCAVCGWRAPSEPAHVGNGGMGRKSDSSCQIPLCGIHGEPLVEGCHRESHRGIKTFEAKYGVDLKAFADFYERAWQAHQGANDQ